MTKLTSPDSWLFGQQWGLSDREFAQWFEKFEESGGYTRCPQIKDARQTIQRLHALDYEIAFATARGTSKQMNGCSQTQARIDTVLWLRDGGFPLAPLHFTNKKTDVMGDILLDDATHHLEAWRATGRRAVCFSQTWNQDWDGERVYSHNEFLSLVLGGVSA